MAMPQCDGDVRKRRHSSARRDDPHQRFDLYRDHGALDIRFVIAAAAAGAILGDKAFGSDGPSAKGFSAVGVI